MATDAACDSALMLLDAAGDVDGADGDRRVLLLPLPPPPLPILPPRPTLRLRPRPGDQSTLDSQMPPKTQCTLHAMRPQKCFQLCIVVANVSKCHPNNDFTENPPLKGKTANVSLVHQNTTFSFMYNTNKHWRCEGFVGALYACSS